MLWYKAWLETRVRFLICLFGMTMLCADNVFRLDYGRGSGVNEAYYSSVLHHTNQLLAAIWLLAVTLLTMGGLLREKAVGAASFTLALPFSRAYLTRVRMAAGLMEAIALIVVPWIAMILTGSFFCEINLRQALFHIAQLAGGGGVLYAVGFLVSSLVEGEYTAPLVSLGTILIITFGGKSPYNVVAFMMGSGYYNDHAGLLVGPVPWSQVTVYVLVAGCLILASVKALKLWDF